MRYHCIDVFATQINAQIPAYASWKQDLSAIHINAFTMTWANRKLYAFPPFSTTSWVQQKVQADEAMAMMILPLKSTQVWSLKALHLITELPVLLTQNPWVLTQNQTHTHTHIQALMLPARTLSGNLSKIKTFHQRLNNFCLNHGERAQKYNTGYLSKTCCHFVSARKLIPFSQL